MKPVPPGRVRIGAGVFYDDAPAAIDFLCRTFGFELRAKVVGSSGAVRYSELTYGDGVLHVTTARGSNRTSPRTLGGAVTQWLVIYVDDVDAHHAHAAAAGAEIISAPEDVDYGDEYWIDRTYGALDPEGHQWYFAQRLGHAEPKN